MALTGATGFIGRVLCTQLLAAGHSVHALYRPRADRVVTDAPRLQWIPGDLDDASALGRLVAGCEGVIHCAGAVRGGRRADFDRVNESGVLRMVQAALNGGCRRFLLLSSLAARASE
ncbi:MAG TPA: NAD-dependent epimerase/dehydratase family protein, partial [Steroidobacteraceae bacterium]